MQLLKLPSQGLWFEIRYVECSANVGSVITGMNMLQSEKRDTKEF